MSVEIEVVEDPARACAAILVGAASGGGHVVLTGGSTPRTAYQEFATAVRTVDLDLGGSTFWFGDERCVAPEDGRSNYGMVKQALLNQLGDVAPPTVHRIKGELGTQAAADDYERELLEAGPPQFDLLLLGIGPDGHMASLFPDQQSLGERSRLVLGVEQAGLEPFVPRVTLTLPALARARQVLFLVSGAEKAPAVAAAFGSDAAPNPHVPSSMLAPLVDEIIVLLDEEAAQQL